MAILDVQINEIGQAGVAPRIIRLETNDTRSAVIASGYLNDLVRQGRIALLPTDIALVSTKASVNAVESSTDWYDVVKSGDNWNLVATNANVNLASAQILVGDANGVAQGVAMSGDATISNAGALSLAALSVDTAELAADAVETAKIADNNVTSPKLANYADEAVAPGVPVLHVFNMVGGATATRTIATSIKIKVIDAWAVANGLGTTSDTVQVKNNAGSAITDALDMDVADTTLVRAGQINDANDEVDAGDNLQCTVTDGGGSDVPPIDVFVLCVPIA